MNERRVIGPPGTGKTHFLSQVLAYEAKEHGSDRVVACSLTHAAANELAGRHVPIPDSNIGTLHSFAYRALGHPQVVEDDKHIAAYNTTVPAALQLSVSRSSKAAFDLDAPAGSSEGDKRFAAYQLLRARMTPRELWPQDVRAFADAWERYKADVDGVDFTDMLEVCLQSVPSHPMAPDVIVADEMQDFSKLGMSLLWRWGQQCDEIVTAGDTDQAIYGFAGADPQVFRDRAPLKQKVLEQSYRVPQAVHETAVQWIGQNTDRDPVAYRPRDYPGSVRHSPITWSDPYRLLGELDTHLASGKTVMLLTTCAYMLRDIITMLRDRGLPYHNPYRPSEGAWNPLAGRTNQTTAAMRVLHYLRPFRPDGDPEDPDLWTEEELTYWLEMTAKLRGRGVKPPEGDPTREVDVLELMRLIPDGEAQEALLTGGAVGLQTLRRYLATRWQRSAGYAIDVALQGGAAALEGDPAVVVGSVHSVKGGEADVVYLWPDLSYAGWLEWQTAAGRNSIRRVFYVGMTRAREELVLCAPATTMAVGWYE